MLPKKVNPRGERAVQGPSRDKKAMEVPKENLLAK